MFYAGFIDYDTLLAFCEEILESDAEVMRQWHGSESKESYSLHKSGARCRLPLLEQFFMVLVRLRRGLLEFDVAHRFGISQSTVSRLTITWLNFMRHSMKDNLERFPPWHIVEKYIPVTF